MEILTLQFGHYANYVGSHFWNFQDELAAVQDSCLEGDEIIPLEFNRLHSQVEKNGVVKWHPRVVIVDKKGALGTNGTEHDITQDHDEPMEAHECSNMWDYGSTSFPIDSLPLHAFQEDLAREAVLMNAWEDGYEEGETVREELGSDSQQVSNQLSTIRTAADYNFGTTVKTWSDFSKVPLPSKSVHELQALHHDVSPFATYFDGLQLRGRQDEESVLDLVRRQVEQSDQLDAVHTVLDMHDGFSGLASLVLNWVQEEQPKCGKFVAPVMPSLQMSALESRSPCWSISEQAAAPSVATLDIEACAWVSAAFSFSSLVNSGIHVWTPLAVPLWSSQKPFAMEKLRYDSFYETSSLIAAALETTTLPYRLAGSLRPSRFLASITPAHRPVCGLLQTLPLPPQHSARALFDHSHPNMSPFFFDLTATRALSSNPFTSLVLRGSDPRRLLSLCENLPRQAHRFSFVHPTPLPLPVPFPQVFNKEISSQGVLCQSSSRGSDCEVEQCPTGTYLHAAAQAGRCESLRCMVNCLKTRQRSPWAAAVQAQYGVDADEFREVIEVVTEHLECAAPSDSEDDVGSDMS